MAHLYRLIAAVLLALLGGAAQAAITPQPAYLYGAALMNETSPRNEDWRSTLDAACAVALAHSVQINSTTIESGVVTACVVGQPPSLGIKYLFTIKASQGGGTIERFSPVYQQANGNTCPANSTLVGGSCICTAPYVENAAHTACQPPPNECQQNAGQPDAIWRYDGGYGATPNPLASELCKAGTGVRCIVKVADPKCTQGRFAGTGNPYWTCRGTAYYTGGWGTGAACDRSTAANGDGGTGIVLPPVTAEPPPDDLPPNTAAPTSCPPGTFEGTVNGTHTCVEDIGRPASTTSPDAGQTVKQNADGSTTTTSTTGTTVCSQGSCTTTNNTTTNITGNPNSTCPAGTTPSGPNGSASSCTGTSTNSGTEAQSEFCKDHPKDKQCGGGGGFGGSCAGGYKATGEDPVLNAMAEEQYKRNCQVLATDSAEGVVVANASDSTGLLKATTPGDATVNIGSGNFDTSNALGGGSCNLNKTITVAKMTATLPFNVICDPLAYLGEVLVAVSLLLAARIVARG